jgi:hypothetical protein
MIDIPTMDDYAAAPLRHALDRLPPAYHRVFLVRVGAVLRSVRRYRMTDQDVADAVESSLRELIQFHVVR